MTLNELATRIYVLEHYTPTDVNQALKSIRKWGSNGGGGRGWGCQGGCERRIEVFVKIQKKIGGGVGVLVGGRVGVGSGWM